VKLSLCWIKHYTMKMTGGVEVWLHYSSHLSIWWHQLHGNTALSTHWTTGPEVGWTERLVRILNSREQSLVPARNWTRAVQSTACYYTDWVIPIIPWQHLIPYKNSWRFLKSMILGEKLCAVVKVCCCFGATYCFHHQGCLVIGSLASAFSKQPAHPSEILVHLHHATQSIIPDTRPLHRHIKEISHVIWKLTDAIKKTSHVIWKLTDTIMEISPPMLSPPYRGGGVWVLLRSWELYRR
jgi:hypothetical protein